jgi:hypothetical protein
MVTPRGFRFGWLRLARLTLFAMGVAMLLITSLTPALASPLIGEKDPDGEIREPRGPGDELRSFSGLRLRNGSELRFFQIPGERGETDGVGVAELLARGATSIGEVERLQELNPAELFNALSEPGTPMVGVLVLLYGAPHAGPQGWGLDLLGGDPQGGGACDADSFENQFGPNNTFVSTTDGPSTKPGHWLDDGVAFDGDQLFRTWGAVYNVKTYYARVDVCSLDGDHFAGTSEIATDYPVVYMQYRNTQNSPFNTSYILLGHLTPMLQSVSFYWHPIYDPAPGHGSAVGPVYDWKLNIESVMDADLLHIGIAWTKPFPIAIAP